MDKRKTILIIEDEAPMLRILTDSLTENAFDTMQANNGQQGLRTALEKHPDLILVDVLMPGMDGLTMLQKLRSDAWGKTVPVVILSNVSPDSNEILHAIVTHQPAYYLVKSDTNLDHIIEKIKEILYPSQQMSSFAYETN